MQAKQHSFKWRSYSSPTHPHLKDQQTTFLQKTTLLFSSPSSQPRSLIDNIEATTKLRQLKHKYY